MFIHGMGLPLSSFQHTEIPSTSRRLSPGRSYAVRAPGLSQVGSHSAEAWLCCARASRRPSVAGLFPRTKIERFRLRRSDIAVRFSRIGIPTLASFGLRTESKRFRTLSRRSADAVPCPSGRAMSVHGMRLSALIVSARPGLPQACTRCDDSTGQPPDSCLPACLDKAVCQHAPPRPRALRLFCEALRQS